MEADISQFVPTLRSLRLEKYRHNVERLSFYSYFHRFLVKKHRVINNIVKFTEPCFLLADQNIKVHLLR